MRRVISLFLAFLLAAGAVPVSAEETVSAAESMETVTEETEKFQAVPEGTGASEFPSEPEPSAEPEPQETGAAGTVRVSFLCSPEDLSLSLYRLHGGEAEEIRPVEGTSYDLIPGSYCYNAVRNGYAPAVEVILEIEAAGEPCEISVTLEPEAAMVLPEAGPTETDFPDSHEDPVPEATEIFVPVDYTEEESLELPVSLFMTEAVSINRKNFPDPGFRSYVAGNLDLNQDGILSAEEQNAVGRMDVSGTETNRGSIRSLQGIEYFPGLRELNCRRNRIENLDLSGNPNLDSLYCESNEIENLNLRGCSMLINLGCGSNRLEELDLSSCLSLRVLYCGDNRLTSLDLSSHRMLYRFYCRGIYSYKNVSGRLNLHKLNGFQLGKTSNWAGGSVSDDWIMTPDQKGEPVLYTYDCGRGFQAYIALQHIPVETRPIFRLYNPYTYEHLLCNEKTEVQKLTAVGWKLDGIAWYSPKEGEPVYRLYNPFDDSHFYTMSQTEIRACLEKGWKMDGIVCCSAEKEDGIPIYRLFNPYVKSHYHLYTMNKKEIRTLTAKGWVLEGIAWYAAE